MFPSSYVVFRLKYDNRKNKIIRILELAGGWQGLKKEEQDYTDSMEYWHEVTRQIQALRELIAWHLSKKYKISEENVEFVEYVHAVHPEEIIKIFYPDQLKLF